MQKQKEEVWRFADVAAHTAKCDRCGRTSPPRVGLSANDWMRKPPGWRAARPIRWYVPHTVDCEPYLRMVRRGASVAALMAEMESVWVAMCRPCARLTRKERENAGLYF